MKLHSYIVDCIKLQSLNEITTTSKYVINCLNSEEKFYVCRTWSAVHSQKAPHLVGVFFASSYTCEYCTFTRKYPLCGYILGVLKHTTAWDQNWGGDETLS